jgi:hypothetical protein
MKRSLRLLIVFSVAASSLLFATPSQAAPTDRWVAAFSPTQFLVKDISNLTVGSWVSLKSIGSPNNLYNPFPSDIRITYISNTTTAFNRCDHYGASCGAGVPFAAGDPVYEVTVDKWIFTLWTLAELTFDSGSSTLPGNTPTFTQHSSNEFGYSTQISNYDPAFTYAVTSSAGSVSIDSAGLITVSGLRPDQTATVTVTTSRSGYSTISTTVSGRAGVLPMLPTNKPTVTISDTLITCTIGSYSATPTSAAFSLFVDGKHISTNFSALGEYLPDWIIPWATSSTITRTASLTSASWTMSDAYKAKAITCATLAYSKNAIGFTASAPLVAR